MKKLALMLVLLLSNFVANAAIDSIGIEKTNTQNYILHKVDKSEGLYAIARKYRTTATAIQEANNLTTTGLQLGQVLKVPTTQNLNIAKVSTATKTSQSPVITAKNYSYENSKEINETGLAGWINDKNSNPKKSIALHNSAVIGTIMKVSNPATGKMVYVKIIGTIPNAIENENLVILLSKAAASLIDATEPKFKVNLTYASPK
jgi:rare lipoprotein A (peptidoglycan hydrolase)